MDITTIGKVKIGDVEYSLDGTFRTLRSLEIHFKREIVFVLTGITSMSVYELADLISIASGKNSDEIGQNIVDYVGPLVRENYLPLKTALVAWLNIAIAPKTDREKKSQEMEAMLQMANRLSSPGSTTENLP